MRDDSERLLDVLEAIERIEKHTDQGKEAFEVNELVQIWVLHHLQIIGEAARSITPELRQQHPEVPWNEIVGMRNVLVHHYFGIDTELVWSVVIKDLPDLKAAIESILRKDPE